MKIVITFVKAETYRSAKEPDWTNISMNNVPVAKYKKQGDDLIKIWLPNNTDIQRDEFFKCLKNTFNPTISIYIVISRHCSPDNDKWKNGAVILNGNKYNDLMTNLENIKTIDPVINDPLIIIFTLEPTAEEARPLYPEWEKGLNLNSYATFYDDNFQELTDSKNTRIIEFKTDTYTILFVKENELKENQGVINLLSKTLEKWGKGIDKKDIYVAIHSLDIYLKDKSKFENKVNYICSFHHDTEPGPDKEFCELLIAFLNAVEKNNDVEKICEQITQKIEELSIRPVQNLTLLKHRIAHLFLPMDIDLQGIAEVKELEEKGEKTEGTAIEYLKEVLEEKRNNPKYYRQKLADLWYMVVKKKYGKTTDNGAEETSTNQDCSPVAPRNNVDNLLASGNAIIGLIDEKKRGDECLKKYWERLLILCGLLPSNNELFNSEEIKLNSASPILKFMQSLDERVENQNAKGIDKILKFDDLETMLENNSAPTDSKVSFHKWFCALDACLEKLREEIKNKGNRS